MSGSVREALIAATARLAAAGVPEAARDARTLMIAALGDPPGGLAVALGEALPPAARAAFDAAVAGRMARRPVAQILGRRAFWGRSFEVTADVLDPRPETEALVALALDGPPAARVLDLGVGSGAILVTLLAEWPAATGLGVDASAAALGVAARNAARHGVAARAAFRRGDWTEGVAARFDLVVCNPPYVAEGEIAGLAPEVRDWEPRPALTAGPTGLEAYRRIAPGLAGVLAPGGRAFFEVGAGQAAAVAAFFGAAGFATVEAHPDLDGRLRVISVA